MKILQPLSGATRFIKSGHACLGRAPGGLALTAGGRNSSLLWSNKAGAAGGTNPCACCVGGLDAVADATEITVAATENGKHAASAVLGLTGYGHGWHAGRGWADDEKDLDRETLPLNKFYEVTWRD